ncbi:CidA/LrgA family protein [Cytobacillus purgationiresistens]|uniref:Holin-like protein n=1 Tax=Cytobacillus purgationiresistens TaxID=863449 RepID=A0ABU0ANS5_9BACI|nr:CidA/LrgA family protein [Cytobacillus purgationiresistens]MDQ0272422.1 holin-like protein [Cytobacillus purgationiresistens]
MKRIGVGVLQVACLCIFTYAINGITSWLNWSIPGSILGLVILFLLLKFKIISLKWIETGGNWLVAELLLFFIPAAVGILQYKQLIIGNGLKILAVLIISSSIVMVCTGLVAEKLTSRKEKIETHAHDTVLKSHN